MTKTEIFHCKDSIYCIFSLSQIVIEGIRGSGIEGDIAIDDVAIEEGECRDPPPNSSKYILLVYIYISTIHFDLLFLR